MQFARPGPIICPGLLPVISVVWISGGVALCATLGLTPLAARIARHVGWVDRPSTDRWRERPVALLGGVAITAALVVGAVVGMLLGAGAGGSSVGPTWPVWVGAGLMFVVGLADDLWSVRPEAKLLAQVLAAALVLSAGLAFWRGGPPWASVPLTFLWVIGVTNALNLIDGIDGLAAGVTTVAASALVFLSLTIGQGGLAVFAAAMAGATLGFMVYNAPPASVFMGDCGSLVLGYLLAVGALGVQGTGSPVVGTLVPIAVLAVPIFDTTFVTLTRLLRGRSVGEGGTDHVHYRLVRLGLSERGAVTVLCGTSAAFGGMALMAVWMRPLLVVAVAALCLVAAAVVGGYLGTARGTPSEDVSTSEVSERVGAFLRTFAGGTSWKAVFGMVADLLVVGAAFVVALHLRYSGSPPPPWSGLMTWALPGIIGTKLLVFYAFGLYEGIWRHAGTPELLRLIGASAVASLLVGGGLWFFVGVRAAMPAILLLDWGVTTAGVGGTRFGFRALRQYLAARRRRGRPVLVYGSGGSGMLLVRYLRHRADLGRTVVGLIDDDPSRQGRRVQGIEVLGGTNDLPHLCETHGVEEVVVPVQDTSESKRRQLREACAENGVECRYFEPSLRPAADAESSSLSVASGDGARDEIRSASEGASSEEASS